ncbi:LysR family transcriptional regulator [Priestia megaterium]|nr:LysR family transcriptional regulator [Priestia megaterium]
MEIRDLEYFIEVANHKNFTKAASQVHLSQTGLSKSVKKIEKELGVELLDRSMRELKLTDAGEIVYQQAMRALSILNHLPNLLDDLMNLKTGEIKMGIPPLIGTLFFPRIAKDFNKQYPKLSLQLIEFGAKKIETLVEEDQVDMGIVMLPITHDQKDKFHLYPFVKEKFVLYTHKNHPLANERAVLLEQLKDEKFIMFSEEFTLHDRLIQDALSAGFMPSIAYKTSQWDLIIELIAAELGIAILPKSIFAKVNDPNITTVPIANETLMWELGIIIRKERYLSFAVRELIHFLTSKAGSSIVQPS